MKKFIQIVIFNYWKLSFTMILLYVEEMKFPCSQGERFLNVS